ncbi:class I SAM-dependent methyltransferase [Kangiella spongicola]|uniref:Methyltransferase type 11 domain-containing protein n=1 Tax=Kangiella spongicola TaxID=796379 RepID=A0A318D9S1_9GAMM|nr:class I SAM-dependent methyltransferase [Kangiella spongicola]PXF64004.1 hypothetical protein DL796_02350 [Kangiella spongicola]
MNKKQRQTNWTKYWTENQIDSCSAGVKAQDSEINNFWADTEKMLNETSSVLDLCTGKGDVIAQLIKLQKNKKHGLSLYTGADIAAIDQEIVADRFVEVSKNVSMDYETDVNALPYLDEAFDIVTSQFGVEYAFETGVVKELCRVMKSTGKARLVLHHSDSILLKVAKEEMSHIDILSEKAGYIELIEQLIPVFAKLRNPANAKKLNKDEKAIRVRDLFNKESGVLLSRIERSNVPDILKDALNQSKKIFHVAKLQGSSAAKAELSRYKGELEQSRERMSDLVEVAVSKEQLEKLAETVNKFGKKITVQQELKSNSHIVAWGVEIA